jgi:hypothetical protein
MLIKTQIDITRGLQLTDLLLKKIPYATNNALTRTAKELVDVEKTALKSEFHIRQSPSQSIVLRSVRITKYSRANDLWTRVAIDAGFAAGSKLLLTLFELGGEKTPQLGSELAIPPTGGAVRPSMAQAMAPRLLYKKLGMQRRTTSSGKVQYKGAQRTFIIPGIGVFQRISSRMRAARAKRGIAAGKGGNIVLLYRFRTAVHLPARMHFVRTAREFVAKRFGQIWREEFARELAGRRIR